MHEHNLDDLDTIEPTQFNKEDSQISNLLVTYEIDSLLFMSSVKQRNVVHTCSRMKAIFSVFAMAPKVSTC